MSMTVSQLEEIKARQQRMWASGDYAAVGSRIHSLAERLCECADLVAGWRVLDAVLSAVGVMFAPDQRRAAAELVRVCGAGGRIALASWTPEGFVGEMLRLVGSYVAPPAGLRPPVAWGSELRLRELLGNGATLIDAHERVYTFRYRSAAEFADFFLANYGPTERAAAALDETGREAFRADLTALAATWSRLPAGGSVAVPATYLEALAVRV